MVEQELLELGREIAEAQENTETPQKKPKKPAPTAVSEPEEVAESPGNGPAPSKNGRAKLADEHVEEASESASAGKNGRVTSIYDEYRELLEETKQTHPIEDSPVGPPLDINLLSNLVYWVGLAKQKVGEEQLKDLLQLYIQSGHSRPELQDLLLHISKMVDVEAVEVDENTSDWVDLMFHLHGILTGGFPVIKIPQIRLPLQEDAGEEGSGN